MTTHNAPAGTSSGVGVPVPAPVPAPPSWVLAAGIAGGIGRTGVVVVPALAALAAGGAKLWRGQPWPWGDPR